MPPEAKITRERILDAAVALVREEGHERLSARRLAVRLGCSTQPLLYHFDSIDALRRETYARIDARHTEFILAPLDEGGSEPLLDIGLRYIRFAAEEPRWFRFLFQSGSFAGRSLEEMIDDPQVSALAAAFAQGAELDVEPARALFKALFIAVHGYASLLANNAMRCDPDDAERTLRQIGEGLILQIKEEES